MIIDSHVHYGDSNWVETEVKEEKIVSVMNNNKVDIAIVQRLPHPSSTYREVHDRIYALSLKYPKRFFGIVTLNPFLDEEVVKNEVERCINKLNFVGIKLHTVGYSISPLSSKANVLFKLASKYEVPLIIHTGIGIPFANPALCILKANEFKDVKIILAHSGMGMLTGDALVAAKLCENIFLETSWLSAEEIEGLIKGVGSERVMMGSDIYNASCYNQAIELQKYKIINMTESERENCLHNTARNVFNLNI